MRLNNSPDSSVRLTLDLLLLAAVVLTRSASGQPDLAAAKPVAILVGPASQDVAVSRDGRHLVTAGAGEARVWHTGSFRPVTAPLRHESKKGAADLLLASISPDGAWVLTVAGTEARVWDVAMQKQLFAFRHDGVVRTAAISPDGLLVMTGGSDGFAKIWDVRTGQQKWDGRHRGAVYFADFSSDGKHVLTLSGPDDGAGGWSALARLWSVPPRAEPVAEWPVSLVPHAEDADVPESHWVRLRWQRAGAFSGDGRRIATITDGHVVIRETASGKQVASVQTTDYVLGTVDGVALNQTGDRLLTTDSMWGLVSLYRVGVAERVEERTRLLDGFSSGVRSAFSPDWTVVVLAGADARQFRHPGTGVWDAATGRQILAVSTKTTPSVTFGPGGSWVAIGESDKTTVLEVHGTR